MKQCKLEAIEELITKQGLDGKSVVLLDKLSYDTIKYESAHYSKDKCLLDKWKWLQMAEIRTPNNAMYVRAV